MSPQSMKRIAVIGSPGSGKSTLSRQLGTALGIPVFHLDRLLWGPGWAELPREERIQIQRELVAQESWVIDGNWSSTMELRLAAADAVVFLDLPRLVCLWSAIRRRFEYAGRERPDMAPACPEKLDWDFLTFIWAFPGRERRKIEERLGRLATGKPVVRLASRRAMAELTERVRTTGSLL